MKKNVLFFTMFTLMTFGFIAGCGNKGKISEVELLPVKNGEVFQYINRSGEIVINSQFEIATVFRDALALAKSSDEESGYGFIDEDGEFAISPEFVNASVFREGIAWVVEENQKPRGIDKKGNTKINLDDLKVEDVKCLHEKRAAFSQYNEDGEKRWGFINQKGEKVINPQYAKVDCFNEGLCAVENAEEEWGYINDKGDAVVSPQFKQANKFVNGKAVVVSSDGSYGVVDDEGSFVINPQFDYMKSDGKRFLIQKGRQFGWINEEGDFVINPQFDRAFAFQGNDLTPVSKSGEWGYIDQDGKYVITPQFVYAYPFNGKLAVVSNGEDFGLINEEGQYEVNPQFDNVSKDYVSHICGRPSSMESVASDYFDVDAAVSAINMDLPGELTYNSTFEEIKDFYEMNEKQFSRRSADPTMLERGKHITGDIQMSFAAFGDAWTGYYNYGEFLKDSIPEGYSYYISVTPEKKAHIEKIVEKIKNEKLSGFSEIESEDTEETETAYADKNKEIGVILGYEDNVIYLALSKDPEALAEL